MYGAHVVVLLRQGATLSLRDYNKEPDPDNSGTLGNNFEGFVSVNCQ